MGSSLAASMWIYTKAVLRDGRKRDPPLDLQLFLGINVESVSWVAEDFLWEREWITETKVTMSENLILEALNYNIDVACPLPTPVGTVVVLRTGKPQSQVREQRNKSGQIQVHSQQCDWVNV